MLTFYDQDAKCHDGLTTAAEGLADMPPD